MKAYFSKTTLLVVVALSVVISASVYFNNPENSASPSNDQYTRSGTAAAHSSTAGSSPINVVIEAQASHTPTASNADNDTARKQQGDALPSSNSDPVILAKTNQAQLTDHDLASAPPSDNNVTTDATGEHAAQINLQLGFRDAQAESGLPPEVAPDSHPPTGKNVASEPLGEHAREVHQQAIIDKAKAEGYPPPEVAPGSHPPTNINIAPESQSEHASEVSKQALMDKAKSEGYLLR